MEAKGRNAIVNSMEFDEAEEEAEEEMKAMQKVVAQMVETSNDRNI